MLLKKEKREREKMKGKVAFNYKFCQWISFQKKSYPDVIDDDGLRYLFLRGDYEISIGNSQIVSDALLNC